MSHLGPVPEYEFLSNESLALVALPPPSVRRELRRVAGLSASDVAEKVGCSRTLVLHWEAGDRIPRGERLLRYARLLREVQEVPRWPQA